MSVISFLQNYPSTNARLFVSACLSVIFVITVLAGMVLRRPVDVNVVWSVGAFLLTLSGIDAVQFGVKRKTEIVTPPDTTAENSGKGGQP